MTSYHSFAKGRADLMPRESWWIGLDRDTFYARVREDEARMRLSTFGAMSGLMNYAPIDPEQEAKWRKARADRLAEQRRGATHAA